MQVFDWLGFVRNCIEEAGALKASKEVDDTKSSPIIASSRIVTHGTHSIGKRLLYIFRRLLAYHLLYNLFQARTITKNKSPITSSLTTKVAFHAVGGLTAFVKE
jgi:hypothetical protein